MIVRLAALFFAAALLAPAARAQDKVTFLTSLKDLRVMP